MGGYISTYLNTSPAQPTKDASGSTVPTTDISSNDVLPLPPARDPPQTTVETPVESLPVPGPESVPTQPPEPVPEPVPVEKTVEVEALPVLHKTQINGGKNKKKYKKH